MIDGESLTELTLVVTNITLTNIADLTTTLLKLEIFAFVSVAISLTPAESHF